MVLGDGISPSTTGSPITIPVCLYYSRRSPSGYSSETGGVIISHSPKR